MFPQKYQERINDYTRQCAQIESQIKELEIRQQPVNNKKVTEKDVKRALLICRDGLDTHDELALKQALDMFVDRVIIYQDDVEVNFALECLLSGAGEGN